MTHTNRTHRAAIVLVALLASLFLIGATTSANTAPRASLPASSLGPDAPLPMVLNYQGRLLNPATGLPKPDGAYTALFGLYNVDAGGLALWEEKKDIVVSTGLFSVLLGDDPGNPIAPALFDGTPRWLSIMLDPDGELLPRIRVAHAPYAVYANLAGQAANSDRLGGSLPGAFAPAAHSHDATNIVSGNLSTDRYHAIDDLGVEGYLANAAGDIALNNGALQATLNADLLDGQHASALANVKFFNVNTFGAFLGGGATFNIGYGPNAGIRLPDSGVPDFSYSFTIPPDYTPGTNLTVRFIWHTPATSCGIELAPNYMSVARAGRTHIIGPYTSSGMTMLGGTLLSAPATANQSGAKDMTINTPSAGTNLLPGDSIIFGLYRPSSNPTDTCANYLAIQGVSVSYQ